MAGEETVRALFDAYRRGDLAGAKSLLAADFVFTSPQDDHIDRSTFLARCFPTADRFVSQDLRIVHDLPGTSELDQRSVLVVYDYELRGGERYRNTELSTVRGGQLIETQVFFGGRLRPT